MGEALHDSVDLDDTWHALDVPKLSLDTCFEYRLAYLPTFVLSL